MVSDGMMSRLKGSSNNESIYPRVPADIALRSDTKAINCWVVGLLGRWVAGLLGCWVAGTLGRYVRLPTLIRSSTPYVLFRSYYCSESVFG